MRGSIQGFKAAAGCLLIAGVFMPGKAWANCKVTQGYHQNIYFIVPTLSIPVGSGTRQIFQVDSRNGATIGYTCDSAWGDAQGLKSTAGWPASNNIIPFARTGLGFSIDSGGGPDSIYPTYRAAGEGDTTGYSYVLRIYKIGPLAEDINIPAGDFVSYMANGLKIYTGTLSMPIVVRPGSCELATSDVPMGEYSASEFNRVGYTTKPIDFSIRLSNCSGAINKIKYSMTPGQGWFDPAKAVMKLDPGNATGLGIQILERGRPVSPIGGAELVVPTNNPANYTFTASYYQTEKVIHAGNANSSMTVQITYL